MMLTHHPELTPFDSLVHQIVDGKVYPGITFEEAIGAADYRHGSTAVLAQDVVTRGVLVDLAADGPLPEAQGVFGELTDLALQFAPHWPTTTLNWPSGALSHRSIRNHSSRRTIAPCRSSSTVRRTC